jgi:transcriptional regulator with XRE-family HTH domain
MPKAQDPAVIAAVAAEIKFRRGVAKISQEELAHRADVNRTSIARMEIAKTQPSIAVLFRLAEAFEVDVSVLVAGIEQRYKAQKDSGAKALSTSITTKSS